MNETLMAATESGDGCEVCIELEALIQTRRSLGAAATPPDHRPRIEDEVARRGIRLHGTGPEREGPCQVCGGTDRFSINTKKQVWNCRGCGHGGDVYALVMHLDRIEFGEAAERLDGRGNGAMHPPKRIKATPYPYRNPAGEIVYRKNRFEFDDGRKSFAFDPPGRNGSQPLLYGCERLADLGEGQPVWIVEGEKKVETMHAFGAVAVSADSGAKSKWVPSHVSLLRGLPVILWPDSDEPGEQYIANAAAAIVAEDPAANIRVVRPFGKPNGVKGRDVCDWQGSLADLAAGAEPWVPQPNLGESARPGEQRPRKTPMSIEWFDEAADSALNEPLDPLIEDLLDEGALSVFYGDSGGGKSFAVMDMTFHVSAGVMWNGKKVNRGLIVYVAAEGGKRIKRRLAALKKRYQQEHGDAAPKPLFALIRYPIDLRSSDADLNQLLALVRAAEQETREKCVWLIVDTLSRAMAGGDENSSIDMGRIVTAADKFRAETGAHFTYVHHSGKDAARGARGHSLLRAATDTEAEIVDKSLKVTKQRDGETGFTIGFTLIDLEIGQDTNGDTVRSAVVEWRGIERTASRTGGKSVPPTMKMLMEVMQLAIAETGVSITPSCDSWTVRAAPESAVRARFDVRMADQAKPGEEPSMFADRKRNNFKYGVDQAIKRSALMAHPWNGERYLWIP
jgi:hypothetical protein